MEYLPSSSACRHCNYSRKHCAMYINASLDGALLFLTFNEAMENRMYTVCRMISALTTITSIGLSTYHSQR